MLNNRMKTNRLKMAGKAAGLLSLFAVVLVMNACNRGSNESARDPWEGADSIMALIEAPVFPDRDFMITDYGARKAIDFDCSDAFDAAINACNEAGGGRVVVPARTFRTGRITLKSKVKPNLP